MSNQKTIDQPLSTRWEQAGDTRVNADGSVSTLVDNGDGSLGTLTTGCPKLEPLFLDKLTGVIYGASMRPPVQTQVEIFAGHVTTRHGRTEVHFQVPVGASKEQKDLAFLNALQEVVDLEYLSIGVVPTGEEAIADSANAAP